VLGDERGDPVRVALGPATKPSTRLPPKRFEAPDRPLGVGHRDDRELVVREAQLLEPDPAVRSISRRLGCGMFKTVADPQGGLTVLPMPHQGREAITAGPHRHHLTRSPRTGAAFADPGPQAIEKAAIAGAASVTVGGLPGCHGPWHRAVVRRHTRALES